MKSLKILLAAAALICLTNFTSSAHAQGISLGSGGGVTLGVGGLNRTAILAEVADFRASVSNGDALSRAEAFAAYRERRRQRSRRARQLRQFRVRSYRNYNPGYTLPPDLSVTSALSTRYGLVTGPNLLGNLNRQLGR